METVVEKIAAQYRDTTSDPEVAKLDWASILAIITELLQVLLPLLNEWCPMDSAKVKANAEAIRPLVGLSWWQRQRYPLLVRWQYAGFARRLGWAVYELNDEVDADEIARAMLAVVPDLSDQEITTARQMR